MPPLETKWLTILMAEPFYHCMGAVCHGKQQKCVCVWGGGILSLDGCSLPWKTAEMCGGHFVNGRGQSVTERAHLGWGHFFTGWGQFAMEQHRNVGGNLSLYGGSLPQKAINVCKVWGNRIATMLPQKTDICGVQGVEMKA